MKTRSKLLLAGSALVGLPLAALSVWVALALFGALAEQLRWYPRDPASLDVLAIEYAPGGIVLTVHAPSGVQQVWRQRNGLRFPEQHHEQVPFSFTPYVDEKTRLLVPYEFAAGGEWLLALKSTDDHWVSMSPYFPEHPTLSEQDWRELFATARPGGPRD